ncbi:hypothetical protein [Streptomyces sp. NPDC048361]|uniref:hypothetical protein n=1 Tax=Streptomyces sp. NPDC048361 TaxID=3154720 RepID=UPI003447C68E
MRLVHGFASLATLTAAMLCTVPPAHAGELTSRSTATATPQEIEWPAPNPAASDEIEWPAPTT